MSQTDAPAEPAVPASCRITVAGPLSTAAGRALWSQFGRALKIIRFDQTTVLDLDGLDQSAIRGLLTLLWDLNHDVVAITNQPKDRLS